MKTFMVVAILLATFTACGADSSRVEAIIKSAEAHKGETCGECKLTFPYHSRECSYLKRDFWKEVLAAGRVCTCGCGSPQPFCYPKVGTAVAPVQQQVVRQAASQQNTTVIVLVVCVCGQQYTQGTQHACPQTAVCGCGQGERHFAQQCPQRQVVRQPVQQEVVGCRKCGRLSCNGCGGGDGGVERARAFCEICKQFYLLSDARYHQHKEWFAAGFNGAQRNQQQHSPCQQQGCQQCRPQRPGYPMFPPR